MFQSFISVILKWVGRRSTLALGYTYPNSIKLNSHSPQFENLSLFVESQRTETNLPYLEKLRLP
jgi:hypothetical protein